MIILILQTVLGPLKFCQNDTQKKKKRKRNQYVAYKNVNKHPAQFSLP